MKTLKLAAAAALALAAIAPSHAQSTWSFANACGQIGSTSSTNYNYGNTASCAGTNGAAAVTASAWSTTRSTTTGATNVSAAAGFASAALSNQGGSGFGIANQVETLGTGAPDHSVDSVTNTTDAVLLRFNTATALTGLSLGWWQGDADVTILRWTGGAAGPTMGTTNVAASMAGWTLVSSFDADGYAADQGTTQFSGTTVAPSFNAARATSSWWLISAYNSTYGGTGTNLSTNNDYFKLLSVSSSAQGTPEPGTLVLAGAALAGVFAARRRKASVSAA
jgi:hypothetical protein